MKYEVSNLHHLEINIDFKVSHFPSLISNGAV